MDKAPTLTTAHFVLRPLVTEDVEPLTDAAADPLIWAQHPASDRGNPAVFRPYAQWLVAAGGALAIVEREGGGLVGTSRFYRTDDIAPDWAVGFTFLIRRLWGGAANREVKAAMIAHLFTDSAAVWFHIAPTNARSLAATAKLGARRASDAVVDYGFGPKPTARMRLTHADWAASQSLASFD